MASDRRVEVTGLSRAEVHAIVTKVAKPTSTEDRDQLNEDCQGNPLILTYLLNIFQRSPDTSVNDAIAEAGSYDGNIDRYYATALSAPLQDFQTRELLALLSVEQPPRSRFAGSNRGQSAQLSRIYINAPLPHSCVRRMGTFTLFITASSRS